LRRALFVGSFVAIAVTAAVVSVVLVVTSDGQSWWREMQRAQRFASSQLARAWDAPPERERLLRDLARDLDVSLALTDVEGRTLFAQGSECGPASFRADIASEGRALGRLTVCRPGERPPPLRGTIAVGAAVVALWALSTLFARKAARPLVHLVDVARRIGEGELRARPQLARHTVLEVRVLGEALAEMA
jgi:hypothetical protein